ncbi:MAG: hypothetical protein WCQ96_02515 [Patescibacteria group bacterium]
MEKKSGIFSEINKHKNFVGYVFLLALVIAALAMFPSNPGDDRSILLAGTIFFVSALMVKKITTVNRSSVFSFSFCLMLFVGIFFLKVDANELGFNPLVIIMFIVCAAILVFIKIIKESNAIQAEGMEVSYARQLIHLCMGSKDFCLLFVLSLWLFLWGAIANKIVVDNAIEEMDGLFVLFVYLTVFISSFLLIFGGMLLVTRKNKKTILAILSFALLTMLFMPLCSAIFFSLLSISEKLIG